MLLSSQTAFTATLHSLIAHGYPLMYVAMVFEGPLVLMAASFGASLGYFNIWAVLLLGVLGDITGDLIWFSVGYFGRIAWLRHFGHRFAVPEESARKIERLLEKHPVKTLLAIKLAPVVPVPGLVAVGAAHLAPARFAGIVTLIIIPKAVLFAVLGYFFGYAYGEIAHYLRGTTIAILVILSGSLLLYFGYRKVAGRISRKFGD
jgi:membrane-associated protein